MREKDKRMKLVVRNKPIALHLYESGKAGILAQGALKNQNLDTDYADWTDLRGFFKKNP
jgi:hypothetical protein